MTPTKQPPDFPGRFNAFRRSSHWRDLAGRSEDEGEALLLYWMAAECLCKLRHDEEIGSKLLAACGLPTAQVARSLGAPLARHLAKMPTHRSWRKRLTTLFGALRSARNNIVHAGYRHVDLPKLLREDQRNLGLFVLPLVTRCLSGMALQAMNLHKASLAEMWQNYEAVLDPQGLVRHAEWFISRLESDDATRGWVRGPTQIMRVSQ